ncbi:GFA family protein [Vibrio sp.]|uniref:GFA family protein n=1 Tax=Vibrio sp. TaxID=678 RepID=UPI003D0E468C
MYQGKCHCGNVTVTIPHLTKTATSCNCSICYRYAAIWGYFTEREVKIECGETGLKSYCHGEQTMIFHHCAKCGCVTHYSSTQSGPDARIAVNYRMFDRAVVPQMRLRHFDGADSWRYLD